MDTHRIAGFVGRGLIGALAGLVIVGLGLVIAANSFHVFTFTGRVADDPTFPTLLSCGIVGFALLAAICGEVQITGGRGATIRGILAGALIGFVGGGVLGWMGVFGANKKYAIMAAMFVGGPTATVLGGDRRGRALSHRGESGRGEPRPGCTATRSPDVNQPKIEVIGLPAAIGRGRPRASVNSAAGSMPRAQYMVAATSSGVTPSRDG